MVLAFGVEQKMREQRKTTWSLESTGDFAALPIVTQA